MSNAIGDRFDSCEVNNPDTSKMQTRADLLARIARLQIMLSYARRVYADLVAAGRAVLVADADGEPDPLSYLRDELPTPPPQHPLTRGRRTGGGDR